MQQADDDAQKPDETLVPDPANPRAFRDALGRFATGVTVVTACEAAGSAPVGITVNSFASVSLDPALVLWSAARSSLRHAHFSRASAFAIHVLGAAQTGLAERFSRSDASFSGIRFSVNEHGVPLLAGSLARFECLTEAQHEGGDHTIIIGRVTRFTLGNACAPLVFARGRFGRFDDVTG